MPRKNSGLTGQGVLHVLRRGPEAEMDARQQRGAGLHVGFAEEECDAGAGQHDRDAHGDVVHSCQRADRTVQAAQRHTGDSGGEQADPWVAGFVGRRIGDHGAEHEHAFVAEVDAAGFFGQALAYRHEQEGRADAQAAGQHGGRDGDGGGHRALGAKARASPCNPPGGVAPWTPSKGKPLQSICLAGWRGGANGSLRRHRHVAMLPWRRTSPHPSIQPGKGFQGLALGGDPGAALLRAPDDPVTPHPVAGTI